MTEKDDNPKQAAKPRTVRCEDCAGRGVRSWGTDDVTCTTCDGEGRVQEPTEQDRR